MRHDDQDSINEKFDSFIRRTHTYEENSFTDCYERFYDGGCSYEDKDELDSLIEYYNNR
ncbi:hypothetical protein [Aquibacillus saliphilus]|uniref:hypothetical protein n=1 Tax=Aquibacillus saliphilus TaxID=1909422 RepID=UPI001CEFC429|nr:hypothetical protein [Aquibacillus saliphilus]